MAATGPLKLKCGLQIKLTWHLDWAAQCIIGFGLLNPNPIITKPQLYNYILNPIMT